MEKIQETKKIEKKVMEENASFEGGQMNEDFDSKGFMNLKDDGNRDFRTSNLDRDKIKSYFSKKFEKIPTMQQKNSISNLQNRSQNSESKLFSTQSQNFPSQTENIFIQQQNPGSASIYQQKKIENSLINVKLPASSFNQQTDLSKQESMPPNYSFFQPEVGSSSQLPINVILVPKPKKQKQILNPFTGKLLFQDPEDFIDSIRPKNSNFGAKNHEENDYNEFSEEIEKQKQKKKALKQKLTEAAAKIKELEEKLEDHEAIKAEAKELQLQNCDLIEKLAEFEEIKAKIKENPEILAAGMNISKSGKPKSSSVLSIQNLTRDLDQDHLKSMISQFGDIVYLRITKDKINPRNLFANCKISTPDGADKAKALLEENKNQIVWMRDSIFHVKKEKSVLRMSQLPGNCDEETLRSMLTQFGNIIDLKLIVDTNDNTKWFATAELEGTDSADKAKLYFDGLKEQYDEMKEINVWVVN